jgi:hypothetical protein
MLVSVLTSDAVALSLVAAVMLPTFVAVLRMGAFSLASRSKRPDHCSDHSAYDNSPRAECIPVIGG